MVNPEETASAPQSSSDPPQAKAQLAQQHITVTNRQLNITPFVIKRDLTNMVNRWDKWQKDTERFFSIYDLELRKDSLIIYGGCNIADLKDSLPDVETTDPPADDYFTRDNTISHPRHCYPISANCYPTSANWGNTWWHLPTKPYHWADHNDRANPHLMVVWRTTPNKRWIVFEHWSDAINNDYAHWTLVSLQHWLWLLFDLNTIFYSTNIEYVLLIRPMLSTTEN